MPQVAIAHDAAQELSQTFRRAWDQIVAEQRAILNDPSRASRRARLRELRAEVEALMNEVDSTSKQWVQTRLRTVYKEGALAGEVATAFSWTQTHLDALYVLQKDTMQSVLSATRYVRRDTKRFIREMSKSQLLDKLTTGKTAVQAGRNIEKLLRERGISAVVYRNGARHGLREYGEMLATTKTAEAYNIGTLNQSEQDTKYWEILDGPECGLEFHDDGTRADGMIVDRHTAEKFVISHPRCRRSFAPRPDLNTKKDVREAKPSVTESQRQDVRQADRARRALRTGRS